MKKYGHKQREKVRLAYYRPKPPFRIIEGVGEEPFNRLSPWVVWVLTRFYSEFKGKSRANLSLTYRDVITTMSNVIFVRTIWELVGFAFIDIKRFSRLERNASLYALSDRWRSLCELQKCDYIEAILKDISKLQRERGVVCKRMKLCVRFLAFLQASSGISGSENGSIAP